MSGEEYSEETVEERGEPAPQTFDTAKLLFLSEAGEKIKELLEAVKRFKASIDWGLATSNITRSEKYDILDILRCAKAYEDLGMLREAAEEYSEAFSILQSSKSVDATLLKTTVTQRQEIHTSKPQKRYSRLAKLLGIAPKEEGGE